MQQLSFAKLTGWYFLDKRTRFLSFWAKGAKSRRHRICYEPGMRKAYREQRWQDARSAFAAALEAVPGDGPSMALLRRIDELQKDPPGADWDGSWRLENK